MGVMKKAGSLEFKVGLFVMLALGILGWLVVKAGDFYLKPSYSVRLVFNFVSGIDRGSPVRLAGVNVGEVKEIRILRTPEGASQVEVTCWVQQGAFIEEDSQVRVNSMGLLGEKYIEIIPGKSGSKTLSDGGVISGTAPVTIDELTDSGERLIKKMQFTVDNINNVVADPQFQTSVKGTFNNSEKLTKNLLETTDDLKDAAKSAKIVMGRLRDGEGSIGKLLKDDRVARDLEAFVADIKAHPWKLLKRN